MLSSVQQLCCAIKEEEKAIRDRIYMLDGLFSTNIEDNMQKIILLCHTSKILILDPNV